MLDKFVVALFLITSRVGAVEIHRVVGMAILAIELRVSDSRATHTKMCAAIRAIIRPAPHIIFFDYRGRGGTGAGPPTVPGPVPSGK